MPDLEESTGLFGGAFAGVWNKARANCSVAGDHLDPYYDGGCAYAKSWVEAYAQAVIESYSTALANVTFGSKDADCECNLGGTAYATAIAHEIETIYAKAVQTVEAAACTPGTGSEGYVYSDDLESETAQIIRRCTADSFGRLYAKVRYSLPVHCSARAHGL